MLAILAKNGYTSRNQGCSFHAIEFLISQEKLKNISIEEINEIRDISEDLDSSGTIQDERESMQYGTSTVYKEEKYKELLEKTKELLEKFRLEIES